jgi:hypothetical protein
MLLIAKKADLWRLGNFRGPVPPLKMLNEPIRHHQRRIRNREEFSVVFGFFIPRTIEQSDLRMGATPVNLNF